MELKKSIQERKSEFKNSLSKFLDKYDKDLLNAFYGYWTEHNENGKKMRFEYAKNQPFNIGRRLGTWKAGQKKKKRDEKWNCKGAAKYNNSKADNAYEDDPGSIDVLHRNLLLSLSKTLTCDRFVLIFEKNAA